MKKTMVYEQTVTIPTYKTGAPEKNPLFIEKRAYQGSTGKVYPVPICEKISDVKEDVAYKAVEIFNAKIEQGKNYKGTFAVQPAVSGCGECHQTKGNDANWAKGVMDCTPSHDGRSALMNKFKDHP